MRKSEIQLSIFLILFLLFSPISIHANPFDGETFFDNSQNKVIPNSEIIDIDSNFFLENNFKICRKVGLNSVSVIFVFTRFLDFLRKCHFPKRPQNTRK